MVLGWWWNVKTTCHLVKRMCAQRPPEMSAGGRVTARDVMIVSVVREFVRSARTQHEVKIVLLVDELHIGAIRAAKRIAAGAQ